MDPQKEQLKSVPVESDRPIEEQIIEVDALMFIKKIIAVVKTKLFVHFLYTIRQTVMLIHY